MPRNLEGSTLALIAAAAQKLQTALEIADVRDYSYPLRISPNVEGITLDPSDRQTVQILKTRPNGASTIIGYNRPLLLERWRAL